LEYKLRSEFQAFASSSSGSKLPHAANRGDVKYTKFKPAGSRSNFASQPFSSGSGRSSSSSSNCLICAEKGHTVFLHLDSPTPIKFLDGKPTWSKCTSCGLVTPDNRSLCIIWKSEVTRCLGSLPAPTEKKSVHTYALSVANRATMPSPGSVASNSATDDFLFAARSPFLQYVDFSPSFILHLPFPSSLLNHSAIFNRVSHPYNPDAFDFFFTKHGLLDNYPLLSTNLRKGFPLGHMPSLLHTVILPNNPSASLYMDAVDEYLLKELCAGRMSGPFSRDETELIMHGPFQSSPLIVAVQPQHPGIPDKLRICQHLSKSTKTHPSVNSHILKDDFPTRFDMASKVANMVSI